MCHNGTHDVPQRRHLGQTFDTIKTQYFPPRGRELHQDRLHPTRSFFQLPLPDHHHHHHLRTEPHRPSARLWSVSAATSGKNSHTTPGVLLQSSSHTASTSNCPSESITHLPLEHQVRQHNSSFHQFLRVSGCRPLGLHAVHLFIARLLPLWAHLSWQPDRGA